ncbi:MAG: radical SAM family heme chaperone HemW [Coriobacteriales bacterium]|jgi:oxygen-independent coproporphyrinogen-3 oxidase|nr:radical SAM family heme chaperone HemW [Coriobacteriales bacterium]
MALMTDYGALYLHIPFCAKRCGYCDFFTEAVAPDDPRLDDYVEDLVRDIRWAAREGLLAHIKTLYIGGGTPSFLGSRRLVSLVYALALSIPLGPDTEFTVEANPESLTPSLVRDLYSLGVNRFSLGAQSFIDEELEALGRIHTAQITRQAIASALERTENVSLDLMCGIPLQTAQSWRHSLDVALRCGVPHLSVYPLTLKEADDLKLESELESPKSPESSKRLEHPECLESMTPLAREVKEGRWQGPNEDTQAQMMLDAQEVLSAAGLKRYEVASYARTGFACRHNIAYWTGVPYLGLGQGAAGMRNFADGSRERLYNGEVIEQLNPARALCETLMLNMRMCTGVSCDAVRQAEALASGVTDTFEELVTLGLVARTDTHFRPTPRGWLLGNELYQRIWSLV